MLSIREKYANANIRGIVSEVAVKHVLNQKSRSEATMQLFAGVAQRSRSRQTRSTTRLREVCLFCSREVQRPPQSRPANMDASRRRTTMASHQQYQQSQQGYGSMTGLPMSMQSKRVFSGGSSAGGPSFGRQSLMPTGSASHNTGANAGGGRFSMAVPQRVVSGGSMRQSMAPGIMMHSSASAFPSSSQEQQQHFGASSQSQPQSSQNSRFSLAMPGTASKGAGMMSANRQDGAYLRSSMSQQQQHQGQSQQQSSSQGYAPPR